MARKFLTSVDLAQNALNNAQIQNLASAPSSPVKGQIYFDTVLNEFGSYNGTGWVYLGSGGGTVTTVSVASANGFTGTVANATTTPAITIATSVTGLVKGNGTSLSAAVASTDYIAATTGSSIQKASSGGLTAATSGTDYSAGTSALATGIVKSTTSTGALSIAVAGTDYAPATATTSSLKGNGSGGFAAATLNDNAAATADYSINSHKLTSLLDPTSAQDAATKNYVDSVAQGLNVKPPVQAATVGTETFAITSGSVTQINGTTVDGVTVAIGGRILIKDSPSASGVGSVNSTQPGNGIYTVTANTTNLSVSRATDMSGTNGPAGAFAFVEAGTNNAAAGYVVSVPSTNSAFTYGTNNIAWSQFSGAGEITAGAGLAKSGNTISVENSGVLTVTHGGTGAATLTGLVKGNGTSAMTAAVVGTDYAAATTGSSILKGNGSGGFSSAKFTATIGDGSTTAIAVTHSLGTQDVIAQVRDASTNAVVECDVVQTSTSVTTFTFAVAPASNAYKVVIIG